MDSDQNLHTPPPSPEIEDQSDSKETLASNPGMHPVVKQGFMAGLVIVLLGITWWTGTIRADQARTEALSQGISAISVTVQEDILRKDAGRLRLTAMNVAEAGGFTSVSFTDAQGGVLASTDGLLKGKILDHMKKPPVKAKVESIQGQRTVFRAVTLGQDNVVGGVSVTLKP